MSINFNTYWFKWKCKKGGSGNYNRKNLYMEVVAKVAAALIAAVAVAVAVVAVAVVATAVAVVATAVVAAVSAAVVRKGYS